MFSGAYVPRACILEERGQAGFFTISVLLPLKTYIQCKYLSAMSFTRIRSIRSD